MEACVSCAPTTLHTGTRTPTLHPHCKFRLTDTLLAVQLDEREAALRAAQREVEQLRAQMAAWRASVAATEAAIRSDADAAAQRTVRPRVLADFLDPVPLICRPRPTG